MTPEELINKMAKRIAKSCPWLPINGEYKVAKYALEVVLKAIKDGEVCEGNHIDCCQVILKPDFAKFLEEK